MAWIRRHLKVIGVAAGCAAIGAGASAIASAGAATSSSAQATQAKVHPGPGVGRRLLGRAVHGDVVVATKSGFSTVTFDRGFVQSVSAQQLTLREGTKTKTYQTVTLTIPANARVRDNGRLAALSALTVGQRVLVLQGPKRTVVRAHDVR